MWCRILLESMNMASMAAYEVYYSRFGPALTLYRRNGRKLHAIRLGPPINQIIHVRAGSKFGDRHNFFLMVSHYLILVKIDNIFFCQLICLIQFDSGHFFFVHQGIATPNLILIVKHFIVEPYDPGTWWGIPGIRTSDKLCKSCIFEDI